MVSWQERRDIAGLRGELENLRTALGAVSPDQAVGIVRGLKAAVADLQQRVTNLEAILAAQGHASISASDSGTSTDTLGVAVTGQLQDSGTGIDSITVTIS